MGWFDGEGRDGDGGKAAGGWTAGPGDNGGGGKGGACAFAARFPVGRKVLFRLHRYWYRKALAAGEGMEARRHGLIMARLQAQG